MSSIRPEKKLPGAMLVRLTGLLPAGQTRPDHWHPATSVPHAISSKSVHGESGSPPPVRRPLDQRT
ncbi:MAG: hypothetical protein ACYS32_18310 [Planctomycetota bacterium]